jgi:hypothetical protein
MKMEEEDKEKEEEENDDKRGIERIKEEGVREKEKRGKGNKRKRTGKRRRKLQIIKTIDRKLVGTVCKPAQRLHLYTMVDRRRSIDTAEKKRPIYNL